MDKERQESVSVPPIGLGRSQSAIAKVPWQGLAGSGRHARGGDGGRAVAEPWLCLPPPAGPATMPTGAGQNHSTRLGRGGRCGGIARGAAGRGVSLLDLIRALAVSYSVRAGIAS